MLTFAAYLIVGFIVLFFATICACGLLTAVVGAGGVLAVVAQTLMRVFGFLKRSIT